MAVPLTLVGVMRLHEAEAKALLTVTVYTFFTEPEAVVVVTPAESYIVNSTEIPALTADE